MNFKLNVIGHISAGIGLGVSARNVISALIKKNVDIAILDLDPGGGRHRADNRFEHLTVNSVEHLPARINLWILPPHSIAAHVEEFKAVSRNDSLNAAFIMWELPTIPDADRLVLEMLDIAISGSDFIRYSVDFSVSGIRTVRGMQPLYLPSDIRADRHRFGLPHDGVIFVFSFEPMSCIGRKNPFAVIAAFFASVGDDPRAHLVIKMNNTQRNGQELPSVQELRQRIGGHPRVTLIAETLDYPSVLSLFASCDVFVSLHRAEGLGLGMLEAMLLGKPVIATAWSGNMSFMRDTNACLVGYTLIPTHGTVMQYQRPYIPKGTVWADPSIAEAGAWMKRLLNDPDLRRRKGEAARRDALAYCEEAERCAFVDEIQAIAENLDPATLAARRKDLPQRLARINKLMNPIKPRDIAKRAWLKARAPLDRHLLWRFRAENRRAP